eukprot:5238664-Ditylum_brightwellii.AAC.1
MLKCVNNVQKENDRKWPAESDSEHSKSEDSLDYENKENDNEEDSLPITQDDNKESETVTKELSEDKMSMQV